MRHCCAGARCECRSSGSIAYYVQIEHSLEAPSNFNGSRLCSVNVKVRQSCVLRPLYVLTPESGTQIDVGAGVYFVNKPSYDLCGCAPIDLKAKISDKIWSLSKEKRTEYKALLNQHGCAGGPLATRINSLGSLGELLTLQLLVMFSFHGPTLDGVAFNWAMQT